MSHAQVWVAYAAVNQQFLIAVPFTQGMTAIQAIELSQIRQQIEIAEPLKLGIFGVKITLDTPLKAGDRVEIYRPLMIHPQDIRRNRAQKIQWDVFSVVIVLNNLTHRKNPSSEGYLFIEKSL